MKLIVRIVLSVLCALLVLAAPFALSSPNLLEEAKWEIQDAIDAMDSGALFRLIPSAVAEGTDWIVVEEEPRVMEEAPRELPMDFSAGMTPNPAAFTDDSYEDASIRVQIETREGEGNVVWRIAWVEIASPTQLRTAFAGKTVKSDATGYVSQMAKKAQCDCGHQRRQLFFRSRQAQLHLPHGRKPSRGDKQNQGYSDH